MSRPDLADILALSRYVNDLLRDYVAIHDAIIPRPTILGTLIGLFKPIDFESHRSNLEQGHSELAQTLITARDQMQLADAGSPRHIFLTILERYIVALSDTIGRLRSICERLKSKIQRRSAYRLMAYRADMKGYYASIERYGDIGKLLNRLLPAVNRSEPLSEHDLSAALSTERTRRILALARELSGVGKSPTRSISDQLGGSTTSEQGQRANVDRLEELFALCESDPVVRQVMERHGANRDTLRRAYARLLAGGAGGWVGGHYVAVSALAYGPPLEYVLSHFHEPSSRAVNIDVAFRLNEYFEGHYGTEAL